MGQALYRKYRPKKLADVAGQRHIVTVLSNAIKSNKVSHAYLFTGPRGVGKTSVARIMAHEVNALPYKDDSSHIDIIEIDAASNRRIDEIRELREKVNISPAEAKYKVYIIDEVHMLTKEAFNALLKTLEEPPEHAIFILATTDAHKVPETIISRTQRFAFKPIDITEMTEQIYGIAQKENLQIDKTLARTIAAHGQGSFRDSLSLLDQVAGANVEQSMQENLVSEIVGKPSASTVQAILNSVLANTGLAEIMNLLENAYSEGAIPTEIAKSLSGEVRGALINSSSPTDTRLVQLLDDLLMTQTAIDPAAHLEIALFRFVAVDRQQVAEQSVTSPVNTETAKINNAKKKTGDSFKEATDQVHETRNIGAITPAKPVEKSDFNEGHWNLVLESLKMRHNTLYGVIRMAEPRFGEDKLVLAFEFSFHQKRASEKANYQKLAEIINEVSGQTIEIEAIVEKNNSKKATTYSKESKSSQSIEAISNIFDGAELLES